jgi:rhodanese-related sulfurtransferase
VPKDATLVAYCIKDFRGYEVARALRRAGYSVRVMDDPGLQGWKKAKLPTAGDVPKRSDEQATEALQALARR